MAEWDNERAEEKKRELKNFIMEELLKQGLNDVHISKIEQGIFSNGIYLSPPEKPDTRMGLITMNSFHTPSESTKPGNIRMNINDFLESIGTGVMTFAGGLAYPWLYLVGFTLLWKQLWDCATIEIGERENKVLWAMYKLIKEKNNNTFNNIYRKVNSISEEYNIPKLEKGEISIALENLESISSIEKTGKDEWRIIEWINVKYR